MTASLLAHLLRWDAWRFRFLLIGWLLIVTAAAALEWGWPALAADTGARRLAGVLGNLLALAQVLFSGVLIAQVVHAHPLVGTTAFWMTRPIPPGTLLGSKLVLLAAMMIAAPVVAGCVLMAAYDVPAWDVAGVSAQTALLWAVWVTVLMAAASLTPTFARFALLVGGALVAAAATVSVIVAVLLSGLDDRVMVMAPGWVSDPTSGLVTTTLTAAAAILLLVVQYRTRLRMWSCAAGAAGIALAYTAGQFWPWPFLAPTTQGPAWTTDASMLELRADAGSLTLQALHSFRDRPLDWRMVRARVQLRRISPGWTADVAVREAALQISGEPAVIGLPAGLASVPIDDLGNHPQMREVTRRLLNVDLLVDGLPHERGENTVVLVAREPEIARAGTRQGTYEGRFQVLLTHHVIEAVLPLMPGAVHQRGAYRLAIRDIQSRPGHVWVLAQQSNATHVFARQPPIERSFYLRNERTSTAIRGSARELRTDVTLMRALPFAIGFGAGEHSGFRTHTDEIQFPPTYASDAPLVAPDTWLDRAELVIVRSTQHASVERTLTMPDFVMPTE